MKKGVSEVVFIGIMALIALSAVSLVALSINNFIKPSLSPELSCLDYQLNSYVVIDSACYNEETEMLEVYMSRSLDSPELNSITLKTGSNSYTCGNQCGTCTLPSKGETKKFILESEQQDEVILQLGNCAISNVRIESC